MVVVTSRTGLTQAEPPALITREQAGKGFHENGPPIGGEAHDFVFGAEGGKSQVMGHQGVKESEPVFVGLLPDNPHLAPIDHAAAGARVLAFAIDAKKGRPVKR